MAREGRLIRVEVAPTHLDGFMEYFGHNLRNSRQEPGCIQFRAARSPSEEKEGGPAIFHVWEEFVDEAAMRSHHASAHFQRWSAWRAEQGDAVVRVGLVTELWPED
jgi:quinol monooxygenase YgiN